MGSGSEDATSSNSSSFSGLGKTCADCGTSKTPLWRGGPAGPKSLCNACGIRSCKKKRAILGISSKGSSGIDNIKKRKRSSSSSNNSNRGSLNLKQSLLALGREVMMHRSSHMTELGEEEQAAVLLMSLSYGSVYA